MTSLLNAIRNTNSQAYWVVHPLDDHPESKRNVSALGPMPMSPSVRLSWGSLLLITGLTCLFLLTVSFNGAAHEPPPSESSTNAEMQTWNWHVQNTEIVQSDPGFPAKYSGPNSLNSTGNAKETISLDLFAGVRLWCGAEAHMDGLMWQGFGLSTTHGIESFPEGPAYKAGTTSPNFMFARLFLRQTIGLGGEQEDVPDDQLTLADKQDISRLTFTIGQGTPLDVIDRNTHAQDLHTQFMSWG